MHPYPDIPGYARAAGIRVSIHIRDGNWKAAHDAIDHCRREQEQPPVDYAAMTMEARLELPLAELIDDVRIVNTLESINVLFVGQVLHRSVAELIGLPGFGLKSLKVLREALGRIGFH